MSLKSGRLFWTLCNKGTGSPSTAQTEQAECCAATALQCYSATVLQCCSATVLQCYSAAVLQCCMGTVLQCYI